MKGKLFVLMFCMFFLVATVSAFQFDNVKSIDNVNPYKITVHNAFNLPLIGNDLATVELINYTGTCFPGDCWMYIEIDALEDGIESFNYAKTYYSDKITLKEGAIQEYQYWLATPYVEETTRESCSRVGDKLVCETIPVSINHDGRWVEYNPTTKIGLGKKIIRMKVDVSEGETVDIIPRLYGIDLTEWAAFTGLTRYEYYNIGPDNLEWIDSDGGDGNSFQTFTVGSNGTNESFILEGISFETTSCGAGTIINATLYDAPPNLTSIYLNHSFAYGTLNVSSSPNGWQNMTFTENYTIEAGAFMAIHMNSTAVANGCGWRSDRTGGGYIGGYAGSEGTGIGDGDNDAMFEIWGSEVASAITIIFPTNTTYNLSVSDLNYSTTSGADCWNSQDGGQTNSTSVLCGVNFTSLTSSEGNNTWTVFANTSSNKVNSTSVTFTLDRSITVNSILDHPLTDTNTLNVTINFTGSSTISPLGSNLTNTTLFVWNDTDLFGTNTTTLNGSTNTTTLFFGLAPGNYSWNYLACGENSTTFACNFNETNRTIQRNFTSFDAFDFNASTREISFQHYTTNISVSTDITNITEVILWYNGTRYNGTAINETPTRYILTTNFTLAAYTEQVINTFFIEAIGLGTYGLHSENSSTQSQTVSTINFAICDETDATANVTYINYTFQDDGNQSGIFGNIDSALWTYWTAGNQLNNKTYSFSNSTVNPSYAFCFDPGSDSISTDLSMSYSGVNYPIRNHKLFSANLSNSTTNTILYLLESGGGIYTTIQTSLSTGVPISGTNLLLERQISGNWVIIEQGVTGDDGSSTFWVNPNFDHRVTATNAGYVTRQVIIRPSQSTYTLIMTTTEGNASYVSDIEGIKWTASPRSGPINNGTHNFNVTVESLQSNLENCKFELTNATNTTHVLASGTGITNSSYCYVAFDYTIVPDINLFGRLSLDTTRTDGFVIVDADWKWIVIDQQINNWRTTQSFFEDLKDLSEFGEGNKGEFSKFVFLFMLSTILFSFFFYFTGFEVNNPGISILIIWFLVLLTSISGFMTFDSGSDNINSKFEQYGFLIIFSFLTIGYFFNKFRRENE